MSELRNRMIQDMKLAGLVDGTRREYLRAVRQLTAHYKISPDRLTERQVQDHILYVRDEPGVAKGTCWLVQQCLCGSCCLALLDKPAVAPNL